MVEKVGRNDPCPCGSGKKYKSCCLQKQASKGTLFGGRKFTAKVISAGGMAKPEQLEQSEQVKKPVDYTTLMERSFGEALHSHEEKPPVPQNPSQYLMKEEKGEAPSS